MTTDRSRRAFLATATGTAAAFLLPGCGDPDRREPAVPAPVDGRDGEALDLPPDDADELRAIFDPRFEPLGQRVTRAGLYRLDGFEPDDRGDHLALYVEPIDPAGDGWDDTRYVEMVAPGVAASAPFIFERWADVETMDVCQEPPQGEAPEDEPPVQTQILIRRVDAARIDWDDVELADLIAARLRAPDLVRVGGRPEIEEHPLWVAAERAAEEQL
jgi:hypothetical protein